ncbi:uncharacterized protein LOC106978773 [Acinonyx jubatus]|uniref:Uncharacterized protein LOC106978773 n=1 Tax=Acinonyx jubatus TaxID=32536 RepID=A0ABM3PC62_ACIJB|nr:uncharacterized protein LOC106978773 [Acinonyx jubatus]
MGEGKAARGGERACARRPGPFSARFGLAPGPPPLPHPARALPHPLTRRRRRLRPPPPRGRGAAAAHAPESLGARGCRLASPVRLPQPTQTPRRFLRGRSGLRLRHSHPAWAALHVSTTDEARQHAPARVAGPAGNRSTSRGTLRRRRGHFGKCSFLRPKGGSTQLPGNYESLRPVRGRAGGQAWAVPSASCFVALSQRRGCTLSSGAEAAGPAEPERWKQCRWPLGQGTGRSKTLERNLVRKGHRDRPGLQRLGALPPWPHTTQQPSCSTSWPRFKETLS